MGIGEVRTQLDGAAEAGDRFAQSRLDPVGDAQVEMRRDEAGGELQRPPEACDRLIELPLVLERNTEVVVGIGEVRTQLDGAAEAGDRFGRPRLDPVGDAQVDMRRDEAGVELQRPPEACDRLIELPPVLERQAKIVIRAGVIRLKGQGPPVRVDRFVVFPLAPQSICQMGMSRGPLRPEIDSPSEARFRFDNPMDCHEDEAQILMEDWLVAPDPNRALYVIHGHLGIARLMSQQTQKINRMSMIRLVAEDLPIDPLGLLEPTVLMVSDRDRQCFLDGCHPDCPENATRSPASDSSGRRDTWRRSGPKISGSRAFRRQDNAEARSVGSVPHPASSCSIRRSACLHR